MEEKIYQRQIIKQSLSQRVLDEHQLDRHFTSQELNELYAFEPDIYSGKSDDVPIMPEDDILKEIVLSCDRWLFKFHEHDSLLENIVSENLTDEERKAAWAEYEAEKNGRTQFMTGFNPEDISNVIFVNFSSKELLFDQR